MTLDRKSTGGGAAAEAPGGTLYSAHERAERALRARIAEGLYPPGSLLPTERQIVEEVGVSRPMVRAALQRLADDGWITREPGHRPRVARSLPGGGDAPPRSGAPALQAIAAVMPMDLSYPAAYSIQYGIQRTLTRDESPYRLVVFDSLGGGQDPARPDALNAETERRILEAVAREGIAGVLCWPIGGDESLPALDALRAAGVPVVFVDRYPDAPGAPPVDFVGVDNRAGAREAVAHLVRRGHRRIAHLTFADRDRREGAAVPVRERYEGWRDALYEAGITPDPALVGASGPLLEKIAAGGPDAPTAVFAVNDASAHRFIDLLIAAGRRVPEDISVVGFDDLDRLSHRATRLTTMYLPFDSVGERAAELLLRRLRDRAAAAPGTAPAASHLLLSTTLVVRATCADVPTPNSERE